MAFVVVRAGSPRRVFGFEAEFQCGLRSGLGGLLRRGGVGSMGDALVGGCSHEDLVREGG